MVACSAANSLVQHDRFRQLVLPGNPQRATILARHHQAPADIGAVIGHDQLAQLTGFGVEGVQGRGVATLVRGHVEGLVVGGKRHRPENRAVEFMRGVHHLPFGIRRRPVVGQLAQQFAILQRPPPAVRVPYRKPYVTVQSVIQYWK